MAFSFYPRGGERRGLYWLDWESGKWRRILKEYEVVSAGNWPARGVAQYLFAPIPGPVWRIYFEGAPCAELGYHCDSGFPGGEYYIKRYWLYSDGTGLQEIERIPPFQPIPLPEGAPRCSNYPQLSPDGTLAVCYSDAGLNSYQL